MSLDPRVVTVVDIGAEEYPTAAPFHPHEVYPEYPFGSREIGPRNPVYAGVRELFRHMGLDLQHYGTERWNPLGVWIHPGDRVVIKPNFVLHFHEFGGDLDAVTTHGSLVRAVTDFAWKALGGTGTLTVGDAPLQLADFDRIALRAGLSDLQSLYREGLGYDLRLADFRRERAEKDNRGLIVARANTLGDPLGYRAVDLDGSSSHARERRTSSLYSADYFGFRVTNYDPAEMLRHHTDTVHEYLISGSVLDADVVIGIPKLKTHRKAGLTAALKNMVGINGHKDWLPHHTAGSVEEGGDEYERRSLRKRWMSLLTDRMEAAGLMPVKQALYWAWRSLSFTRRLVPLPDPYSEGSWHGNSTLWRTILDLNTILMFADREGRLGSVPQRRLLHIVDAVVAGEGEGPLGPTPKACGLLLAGTHPAAVDAVCASIMGFEPTRVPAIARAFDRTSPPLADFGMGDIRVRSPETGFQGRLDQLRSLGFRAPDGWRGALERPAAPRTGGRPAGPTI